MSWSDTPVNGQQSVAANKTPINDAFTYISTTEKKDHYWDNANSNLDGRHKFVQMPNVASNPPTIGTDMKGVYYMRAKTTAEVPSGTVRFTEPFTITKEATATGASNQILQHGFRALAQFEVSGGTVTSTYLHNCSITRTGTGLYTVTFTTALPSARYIVYGSAMRFSATNGLYLSIANGANKAASMSTTSCKVSFQYSGNTFRDPDVAMIAICGG